MKMPKSQVSKLGLRVGLMLAILFTTSLAQAPRPEPVTDQETELGLETYKQCVADRNDLDKCKLDQKNCEESCRAKY